MAGHVLEVRPSDETGRLMSSPFMQLYVADYLGDTRHLTTEQHGAYLLLLMTMWRSDGVLSSDPSKLARIAGLTVAKWKRISDDILAFFTPCEGGLTQGRLAAELTIADEKSEKRSQSGRAGGRAKALKDKKLAVANAMPSPCHSPEPEPEPDKIDEPTVHCRPKADPLPVQEAFDEWNATASRRRLPIAKSLTPARRRQIKARLAEGGIAGWREALSAVEASPLCRGENERGWRADLDFVCQPKSFAKLREGSYAPTAKPGLGPPRDGPSVMSPELIAARRALLEQASETMNA